MGLTRTLNRLHAALQQRPRCRFAAEVRIGARLRESARGGLEGRGRRPRCWGETPAQAASEWATATPLIPMPDRRSTLVARARAAGRCRYRHPFHPRKVTTVTTLPSEPMHADPQYSYPSQTKPREAPERKKHNTRYNALAPQSFSPQNNKTSIWHSQRDRPRRLRVEGRLSITASLHSRVILSRAQQCSTDRARRLLFICSNR